MEHNRKGKLTVNKFLLRFSLRSGTIFLSWLTLVIALVLLIVSWMFYDQSVKFWLNFFKSMRIRNELSLLLILEILLSGTFLSGKTIYFFPAPDKEYSIESAEANSLLHLANYNGFMATVIVALSIIYCITEFTINLAVMKIYFVQTIIIGFYIHFSLVIRSYYLSILKIDENISPETIDENIASNERTLIVKKFLFGSSLRTGTFIISLITFIYSFFFVVSGLMQDLKPDVWLFKLISGLSGTFLSQKTIYCFPASNQRYSNKSVQAKSLLHLVKYNGILAAILLTFYSIILINFFDSSAYKRARKQDQIVTYSIEMITMIALLIYFTMVTYSYYLSILKTGENINHSISNNLRRSTIDGVPVGVDATPPTYSECVMLDALTLPSYSERVMLKN